MKALTLTQPWASLIALGAKCIETRSWSTRYRGPLAVHAAKGLGPVGRRRGLHALCGESPFCDVLLAAGYSAMRMPAWGLPLGAIVAVCYLVSIEEILPGDDQSHWPLTEQERAFGDYSVGRFAWLLADIRALPEPIPARGALGLWEPDTLTQMAIVRQMIGAIGGKDIAAHH